MFPARSGRPHQDSRNGVRYLCYEAKHEQQIGALKERKGQNMNNASMIRPSPRLHVPSRRSRAQSWLRYASALLLVVLLSTAPGAAFGSPSAQPTTTLQSSDSSPEPTPPAPIIPALAAPRCFAQSDFVAGGHGNFETVVLEGSVLSHYYHANDIPTSPWRRGQVITTQATGPGSIIQSDFVAGDHGTFEVIVPEGSNLVH
jgi:hypothetical protein